MLKLKKYVVALDDYATASTGNLELVKEAISKQGARNIEVHGMGIMTVDSEVPINFSGIRGISGVQDAQEVEAFRYMVVLAEDANVEAVKRDIEALGADSIKHFEQSGVMAVGSSVAINFAGIAGVQAAEPEQVCHTCSE